MRISNLLCSILLYVFLLGGIGGAGYYVAGRIGKVRGLT